MFLVRKTYGFGMKNVKGRLTETDFEPFKRTFHSWYVLIKTMSVETVVYSFSLLSLRIAGICHDKGNSLISPV